MSIGYIVIAYKLPAQLLKLVHRLKCSDHSRIVVHIDRKNTRTFREAAITLASLEHVHVISRHAVHWGHISLVDALLYCLRYILHLYPDLTHVKYVSGQDYPIRPLSDFERLLQSNSHCSFLEFHPLPNAIWVAGGEPSGGLDRIRYPHVRIGRRRYQVPLQKKLQADKLYGGSALWCLHRPHAIHIVEQSNSWRRLFRWALLPEELLFQNIAMNSAFRSAIVNDDITYTDWEHSAPSPKELTENDLAAARNSGCLFARKFDISTSPKVLDEVDAILSMK